MEHEIRPLSCFERAVCLGTVEMIFETRRGSRHWLDLWLIVLELERTNIPRENVQTDTWERCCDLLSVITVKQVMETILTLYSRPDWQPVE